TINKATGSNALNWKADLVGFPNGVTVTVPTPTGPVSQTIDYTAGFFGATGSVTMDVFGFLRATASFSFTTQQMTATGITGGVNVALLSLTVTDAFIGVPGSIGFSLQSGTLDMGFISPVTTTDTRRWMAVKGTLNNASFTGVDKLVLTA